MLLSAYAEFEDVAVVDEDSGNGDMNGVVSGCICWGLLFEARACLKLFCLKMALV